MTDEPTYAAGVSRMSDEAHIAALEREVALLVDACKLQWAVNHLALCGREWPHKKDHECQWPVPDVLLIPQDES